MMAWITVVKPLVWVVSFIPAYGMRAAGDVRFSMITSCVSMWVFQVLFMRISDPCYRHGNHWLYGLECLQIGPSAASSFFGVSTAVNG